MSYIHNKYYCCPKVINAFVPPAIRNNAPSSCRTTLLVLSSGDPMSPEALALLSPSEEDVVIIIGQGTAVNAAVYPDVFPEAATGITIPDVRELREIKMALVARVAEPGHLRVVPKVVRTKGPDGGNLQIPSEITLAAVEHDLNAGENIIVEDIPIIVPPGFPSFTVIEGDIITAELVKPEDSTLTGTSIAVTLTFTLVKCGAIIPV